MIAQGAVDQHLAVVWFLLTAASAGVFLHAGIKFPWFVFFQKDSGLRPPDPPMNMRVPMLFFAFLCVALGVYPKPLYDILPYAVDFVPYTVTHVVAQLQLLLFAGLAFFVLLPQMKRTLTISLDFDWIYRRFGTALGREFAVRTTRVRSRVLDATVARARTFTDGLFKHHGPHGVLARTWPTGSMVLWVAVLLGAYLVFYF